ncbi:hypothetical protein, partial [Bradyrhizobium jicamae]|uniref:hypothetical protein n=1 Tax=Bradyrhizobium jicamae TaxID=280332 RepID=UPI000A828755
GPGQSTHPQSQNGFLEPNCGWVDAPASFVSVRVPQLFCIRERFRIGGPSHMNLAGAETSSAE